MHMKKPAVFIGVLKRPQDMDILLRERWYRIPENKAPKRAFGYIAFYQPSSFGQKSGMIRYYAPVISCSTAARLELLPEESAHPRAHDRYLKYSLGAPRELERPVKNLGRERVSFAYTTMRRLKSARNMHGLFGAPPLENIMRKALKKMGIDFSPEYEVRDGAWRRYRLDFAVLKGGNALDIECDGQKWHSRAEIRKKDAQRDAWLSERGWNVLRFSENDILRRLYLTISRIKKAVRSMRPGLSRRRT
jgi:hypothetical protein